MQKMLKACSGVCAPFCICECVSECVSECETQVQCLVSFLRKCGNSVTLQRAPLWVPTLQHLKHMCARMHAHKLTQTCTQNTHTNHRTSTATLLKLTSRHAHLIRECGKLAAMLRAPGAGALAALQHLHITNKEQAEGGARQLAQQRQQQHTATARVLQLVEHCE